MKATIESTSAIVEMKDHHGRPFAARVWEGISEAGIPFTAYISIAQVKRDQDASEFERDLRESPAPGPATMRAIDLRMVI